MTDRALIEIVHRLHAARVLVLGDVMLDRYVSGAAARLSPEAPVPVLRPAHTGARLGGAANVALNVAALGAQATLIGLVGEDEAGRQLAAMLNAAERISPRLVAAPGRPTTAKTRFLSGRHQLLRLDEESTVPADGPLAAALLSALEAALAEADILILSDYAKGVLGDAVLGPAIARARAAGLPVVADPKRPDFTAYRGVTVLTPNEAEVRAATHIDAADDAEADRAGRRALEQTGGEAVLVTRSAAGLTLVPHNGPALHLPTRAREVADVSGAGDTLVATLVAALAAGAALADAAALANAAAGVVVGKQGTATVSRAELLAALRIDELVAAEGKVVEPAEAEERVAAWRTQGLRIGFANGCFDLIHPGHVRLLREARAACDRLIVALNSDASVRRLKGPARPVQDETARATVMASLAPVDLVTLFDEDTPEALIRLLRPDVLVKGSDYTLDQVVGGDLVQGWGGRVLLVDLAAGHSTSGTIRRMTQSGAG
ncbi:MAG TPA: D-glycero-beta-D-manno-heptose-7-phosphate kinase [Acetobacteraceae bacterium]|nr:D-glycero-beta-D-manno-heptose-7-phosphate kinase [Acetobacteraceae bacterium]